MRFRVQNEGSGYVLTVEDGEGVVLSVPAATLTEAKALQRRAVLDGIDAIAAVRPDVKGKSNKKGAAK
jgi:hypothetical protein